MRDARLRISERQLNSAVLPREVCLPSVGCDEVNMVIFQKKQKQFLCLYCQGSKFEKVVIQKNDGFHQFLTTTDVIKPAISRLLSFALLTDLLKVGHPKMMNVLAPPRNYKIIESAPTTNKARIADFMRAKKTL